MRPDAWAFLPIEAELLSRLRLNATDAARVCGVTVRQLTYWTDRGIVETHDGDNRTYDLAALRKVVAIKRAMLEGYTLERAAQLVESSNAAVGNADSAISATYLDDLIGRVHAFVPKMAAYLALGRLRRLTTALVDTDLERCFGEDADPSQAARRVAGILDQASLGVDRALSELARPAVTAIPVEMGEPAQALPA